MVKQTTLFPSTNSNKHHNTKIQEITKYASWQESLAATEFIAYPGKDQWRERFIYTLLKWAEHPDSLTIMDFCIEYKMDRNTLYRWAEEYPDIKAAYERIKLILANRRYKGALKKNLDKDVVFKDMHRMDPEWDDINRYWAAMKRDEQHANAATKIVIEMERAPNSNLVKERKKEIGENVILEAGLGNEKEKE